MLSILTSFFVGLLVAMLLISYGTGLNYENEIKRDVLVQELVEENKKYKDFVDKQFNELNETNWS